MFPVRVDAPEGVTFSEEQAERDARLLVAGEYPQKGLTVTEGDIDALVANFSGPVPVKVEHMDSPLDPVGLVQRVWREGSQLMGRIAFPPEMAAFLSKRGAKKLSVGLLKAPDWKLLEASLTLHPHVPAATLLADDPQSAELASLRRELTCQRVEQQVAGLKAAGKLLPATEALARGLLSATESAVVTLSDGGVTESVSAVFRRFLEAQPPVVRFGEMAPAPGYPTVLNGGAAGAAASEDEHPFTEDEQEVLRRLGVEPGAVAQTMAADRRQKGVM